MLRLARQNLSLLTPPPKGSCGAELNKLSAATASTSASIFATTAAASTLLPLASLLFTPATVIMTVLGTFFITPSASLFISAVMATALDIFLRPSPNPPPFARDFVLLRHTSVALAMAAADEIVGGVRRSSRNIFV